MDVEPEKRDILDTNQAKAARLSRLRSDVSSVIEVDPKGVATEKYTVGNQSNVGVTDAIDLIEHPGIKVKR